MDELAMLSAWLREIAVGRAPAHILLVGQRGSGKTTLARRLGLEVGNEPNLASHFEPVVLHEELFEVGSFDDLWREIDFHRRNQNGGQSRHEPAEPSIFTTLAADFRKRRKRLLVIVENFYSLLTEQFESEDVDLLKQALSTDADWLTVVATTTARLDEFQKRFGRGLQLFRSHELRRLAPAECATLISSISKRPCDRNKLRPIEILTGGNPRLVSIMATFAQTRSLRQLMHQLTYLIDEHTSYFKSNLESLPAHERRVFVSLADLWTPSTTAEVSRACNLDVNRTSVYLTRLASRGLIVQVDSIDKTRRFQVAERLYNIYYLLRRSGRSAARVRALVDFMLAFYTAEETMASVSHEACEVDAGDRETYFLVAETLLGGVAAPDRARALISAVDPAFFDLAPASFRRKYAEVVGLASRVAAMPKTVRTSERDLRARLSRSPHDVRTLVRLASKLAATPSQKPTAISLLKTAAEISPANPDVLFSLASLQFESGDAAGSVAAVRRLLNVKADMAPAWLLLAVSAESLNDLNTAEEAYRKAAELQKHDWNVQFSLASFLHEHNKNTDDAVALLRNVIGLNPDAPDPYLALADILEDERRLSEAQAVLLQGLVRLPNDVTILHALGHVYYERRKYAEARTTFTDAAIRTPSAHLYRMAASASLRLGLVDEAERLAHEAVNLKPNDSRALAVLAEAIRSRGDFAEAETVLRRAIAEAPKDGFPYHQLGHLFEEQQRWAEAESAFGDAVKRSPDDDSAWRHMGLSVERMGRRVDAREIYRRAAFTVSDEPLSLFVEYLRLSAELQDTFASTAVEVNTFLRLRGRDPNDLDQIARALLQYVGSPAAEMAVGLAREAAFSAEANHDALLTLSEAFLQQSKWREALSYVAAALSDRDVVDRHHERILRLMIRLSAFTRVEDLNILLGPVDDASVLAPLKAAFQLILGERPTVPQEVYLVAEDVKREIQGSQRTQAQFSAAPSP
jgi:tetratricopeptide (TPR) repeat protein